MLYDKIVYLLAIIALTFGVVAAAFDRLVLYCFFVLLSFACCFIYLVISDIMQFKVYSNIFHNN